MAQPIQGYSTYAREALGASTVGRDPRNVGMMRTSAPEIDNLNDGGAEASFSNPQPYNRTVHELRNIDQNVMAQVPQAEANAMRNVGEDIREQSQKEFDAITLREQYKATAASMLPNSALNAMASPELSAQVAKSVAQQKALEPFANASMNPQFQTGSNSIALPM